MACNAVPILAINLLGFVRRIGLAKEDAAIQRDNASKNFLLGGLSYDFC